MSSPVCRYFLNNNCRFGDRCRFSHDVSDSSYGSGHSDRSAYVLNRNQTQNRQSYNDPKTHWKQNVGYSDIQELTEKIRDEAKSVEFENLWPLTSLSVMREGANVPGWIDYSMEELRSAAYTAKVNGRFDEYIKMYESLLRQAKEARSIFLHPGKRAEEVVKQMLDKRGQDGGTSRDGGSSAANFSFAQTAAFSGFASGPSTSPGSGSSSGSVFGSQSPSSASAFGSSPFGAGTSDPAPGLFAMAAKGFVPSASQGSVMNDSEMETASESLLLNQSAASAPGSIFGGHAAAPSPFGGSTASSSPFGGNTAAPSPFGSPAKVDASKATPGAFGSSNVFSSTPATPNVFGSASAPSNVFGVAPSSSSSPFSSQGTSDDGSVYTPIERLTESDLEQFRAETFSLNKIPLVPPPKELC